MVRDKALFVSDRVSDYAVGFGGKFGVQADRQDKSAVGWDHHESLHQHESQTDQNKVMSANFKNL